MSKRTIVVLLVVLGLAAAGGGILWQRGWFADDGGGHSKLTHAVEKWTCSMHPFIIRDKPGTCPICGMELIKVSSGEQGKEGVPKGVEEVAVSPAQRVMANVRSEPVRVERLVKSVTATGTVQYDQSRQAKVTAWVAGRIEELSVDRVGAVVSKERPVALLYSPELYTGQQEYLLALKSRERIRGAPVESVSRSGDELVAAARRRLELFGVKEEQLKRLEQEGKPNILLPVHTPLSGIVVEKNVQKGQYVNTGDVLFSIADLSHVWVEIDLYEAEIPLVTVGTPVTVSGAALGGRKIRGRVASFTPVVDPRTRTLKARVELPNPGGVLRPDMFVTAELSITLPPGPVVPVSAVVDTGSRQTVWVEKGEGHFEPRTVTVGERAGDRVRILDGLSPGEKVAVSGAYLIDSESQLSGGGGHAGHDAPAGGAKPAAPSPPPKKPVPMDDMRM